jgi:hypothetical protein
VNREPYAAKLRARGIENALQLRDFDVRRARKSMTVVGTRPVNSPSNDSPAAWSLSRARRRLARERDRE